MSRKKRKKRRRINESGEICGNVTVAPNLEPVARALYKKACCGSQELWFEVNKYGGIKNAPLDFRLNFLSKSNEGMRAAQQDIVRLMTGDAEISPSEIVLYRGIADSIAWQFIGNQLCHARALYKEQMPPSLKESNFESVLAACDRIVDDHPNAVPLISDLTSFVQIGDILASIPGMPLRLIEVKEGSKNHKLIDILSCAAQEDVFSSKLEQLLASSSYKTIEQLSRMTRQAARASHVAELINLGVSINPDTSNTHFIHEEEVAISSWSDELHSLIEASDLKGWAITVIDDCMFIGAYSNKKMIQAAHFVFNSWFESCGGEIESPRESLFDSMRHPLALPLFNQDLRTDWMFDLLFGRLHICMGINVEAFIIACLRAGIEVREGTKRETSRALQMKLDPVLFNSRVVFMKAGATEYQITRGIFLRIMYHSQRPVSLITALLNNPPTRSEPKARI